MKIKLQPLRYFDIDNQKYTIHSFKHTYIYTNEIHLVRVNNKYATKGEALDSEDRLTNMGSFSESSNTKTH